MPLQHRRYPVNWRAVANALKAAVDWRCQACDQQCRKPGEPYIKGFLGWWLTLTVAHVEPESQDPDAEVVCVQMLCSPCHADFDRQMQAQRQRRYLYRHHLSLPAAWARQAHSRLSADEVAELWRPWMTFDDLMLPDDAIDHYAEFEIVGESHVADSSS